jgi:hypothetical protein
MKSHISRRAVLRGAASTIIGLPLLECMLDGNGVAYADGTAIPKRYFLMFSPTSLVTSASYTEGLTPTRTGFNYDITSVLRPLSDRGIASDVSAVSGLFVPPTNAPGAYKSDYHGQGPFAVMTGVRSGFSGINYEAQGLSADQIVAKQIGSASRYPFLYFQLDPKTEGMYVCHEARPGASGEYRAIAPQTSPTLAYRQLFAGFAPPSGMVDPNAELEKRLRQSSLSYASDRIRALNAKLGASDKRTLDEHLTRIRTLETWLASNVTVTGASCKDPKLPGADPADVSPELPNQDARAALFADLIEMAFACDMTRVVTLSGASAMTNSGMRHPLWSQIGGLHGEVQHRAEQTNLDNANRWFVDVYAQVVSRFKRTQEGAGSVLDNTVALFVMEGGRGTASDPQRSGDGGGDPNHSVDNAIMLVGGRAGGLKSGQHVKLTGQDLHHGVVFNSAYKALGVTGNHGEISGTVDKLFTT